MSDDRVTAWEIDHWKLKLRVPEVVAGAPVVLLIHGWTGDEDSMWVFSSKLSQNALLIAPRGLYPSGLGGIAGFSWVKDTSKKYSGWKDFQSGVNQIADLIGRLAEKFPANFEEINLVGFSQGAAQAVSFLAAFPDKVKRLAVLSGFLPTGLSPSDMDLAGVNIFIGHGSLDNIVPPEKAAETNLFFQAAGANVDFCLTDVGHKLGSDCFRGFHRFFSKL